MPSLLLQVLPLAATTLYQAIASWLEDRSPPPGALIDVGTHRLHLYTRGDAGPTSRPIVQPTVVLDHSLGGLEGYLLIEQLSELGRVCIYDRAGYGWSDPAPLPRTSRQIARELDTLLSQASIQPPYVLVGDSFGSYTMRLYAGLYPEKVAGIVLTDALHEQEMLRMPVALRALKLMFLSGFLISIVGSALGLVRALGNLGVFERLKPELRRCPQAPLHWVKRSFYRPRHWLTMARELWSLDVSARQVAAAHRPFTIPVASIKAASFFTPALWTGLIPLKSANQLRDKMHRELRHLSSDFLEIEASRSSHFVWIDQPDVIISAVRTVLDRLDPP